MQKRYVTGQKRCKTCAKWIRNAQNITRCPDCNFLLKYRPKHAGKTWEGVRY